MSLREYVGLVHNVYVRHWKALTIPLLVVLLAQMFVRFDVNITDSLPDKVFLTVKGWNTDIKVGDYIAFEYQGSGATSPFPKGFHFVKIVGAVAGDEIVVDADNTFYRKHRDSIDGGTYLGRAKEYSRAGKRLEAGRAGVVPNGQYYVYAPHPDSLDSRYALTGLVHQQHIIGRTFALF